MEEKKERKTNLLTIRVTEDDAASLEYLSDYLGKSKSDTVMRACKFLLSLGDTSDGIEQGGYGREKERKTRQIHVRVTGTDLDRICTYGGEDGPSVSNIIRSAIKKYCSYVRTHY